ncbi:hypothetical protein AAG570_009345 [Ranatra chinensis]|uniref:Major facilitator superfamily (MFS) profile domain-containing protein n=1 Tax=Ranatra chinensis TaxID=642074 RepID=A0ABD0YNT0_9HEMI
MQAEATSAYTCIAQAVSWTSSSLVDLRFEHSAVRMSEKELELINVALGCGTILGFFLAIFTVDWLGRKLVLIVSGICMVMGWFFIAAAANVPLLFAGRLSTGIGCGFCRIAVPLYIVEITQPDVRRKGLALVQCYIAAGIAIELIAATVVDYKTLILVSAVTSVCFTLMVVFLLESPYFFISTGRKECAIHVLKKLRQKEDVSEEVDQLEEFLKNTPKITFYEQAKIMLTNKAHLKATSISTLVLLLMEFSGPSAILSQAETVFTKAGMGDSAANASAMVSLDLVLCSPLLILLVRSNSIKKLLVVSSASCALVLMVLAIYFILQEAIDFRGIVWFPLLMLLLYYSLASLGILTFAVVLGSEVIHPDVKTASFAVASALGNVAQILTLLVIQSWPVTATFCLFATSATALTVLTAVFLPDTKDLTLKQIQELR